MSANFLDTSGLCMGTDYHMFFAIAPPLPPPIPVPLVPHIVGDGHDQISKFWRIAFSVTTDGKLTLQSQWAMLIVPHVFTPVGPPHPAAETIQLNVIIATSSAAPQLAVHGVTGEKQNLLTELYGSVGLNLDCGDFPAVSTSTDLNLNSVKTAPTLGDYLGALLGAALSQGYAWLSGVPGGKIEVKVLENVVEQALATLGIASVQTLLDYLSVAVGETIDIVNYVFNWIAQQLQKAFDSQHALST